MSEAGCANRQLLAGPQAWETFRSAKQERTFMAKLAELARLIKADLMGEPDAEVTRARPFELASKGDVTLALDAAYAARVNESPATAVIVSAPITASSANLLVAGDPKLAFARAIEALHKTDYKPIGVSGDLIAGGGT